MVNKSSKYIENKENMPIAKEILDMLDLGLKPSQVFSVPF